MNVLSRTRLTGMAAEAKAREADRLLPDTGLACIQLPDLAVACTLSPLAGAGMRLEDYPRKRRGTNE